MRELSFVGLRRPVIVTLYRLSLLNPRFEYYSTEFRSWSEMEVTINLAARLHVHCFDTECFSLDWMILVGVDYCSQIETTRMMCTTQYGQIR